MKKDQLHFTKQYHQHISIKKKNDQNYNMNNTNKQNEFFSKNASYHNVRYKWNERIVKKLLLNEELYIFTSAEMKKLEKIKNVSGLSMNLKQTLNSNKKQKTMNHQESRNKLLFIYCISNE